MTVLVAAVILIGLLCGLDLLLTLGVVKRLRQHTELLSGGAGVVSTTDLAVGDPVGAFQTSTVDGERLDDRTLAGTSVVAFFSPDCGPCKEKMPKFVEFAATMPRDRVLAVVAATPEEAAPAVAALAPVARVVVEGPDGPLGAAFQVNGYPTILAVSHDDGQLRLTSNRVRLNRPAVAAA
ncbi:TlpA family protein disulfide reductase [Amycolatopsis pigmentata]|uniref:TlpA family protein disulfide reductase n=1 Tax=Amycolatopsis pigmentata TaxID=450801 RepID=A0ABW5FST0_9PSEU